MRVVCTYGGEWVDIAGNDVPPEASDPAKGQVYTVVKEIREWCDCWGQVLTFYYLAEKPSDHCYDARHFSPVRETSIEVFRQIALGVGPKVPEKV